MTNDAPRPSQLRILAGLTRFALRATFRNKAGYFFSFVFPLLFVSVFGLFGNARQAVRVGLADGAPPTNRTVQAAQRLATGPDATVKLVPGSEAFLRRELRYGRVVAVLLPGREETTLLTAGGQSGTAVRGLLEAELAREALAGAGMQSAAAVAHEALPEGTVRHIDFILPGQIGFAMLSLATFGMAFSLNTLRKTLVLKRMLATAARPLTFVVAQGLSRSVQAVFQSAALIAVGVLAFQFHLARGWLTLAEMLVLSFLGILAFLGFGIFASNLADDDHVLPVMLNLFNLPQVLLAGVFFPSDALPGWVQAVGNHLPLSYLTDSMRKVALEGQSLLDVWPSLLGLFAWGAAAYFLAAKTFRAE